MFYCALGAIIGGRVGYMLVYGLAELLANPLSLFTVWKGGMSFHGGLSGVLVAMWLYGARHPPAVLRADRCHRAVGAARASASGASELHQQRALGQAHEPGRAVGRIVNGEPRHASQLYEAFLEGLVLFTILWVYRQAAADDGRVGLFLLCYGLFRILVEFVRVPDEQIGYLAFGWVTMGQLLSVPMVVAGVVLFVLAIAVARLDGAVAAADDADVPGMRRQEGR